MVYRMTVPPPESSIQRTYTEFSGVDFTSRPEDVKPYRSPDSKNMIKDYAEGESYIQSRKAFEMHKDFSQEAMSIEETLIHNGKIYQIVTTDLINSYTRTLHILDGTGKTVKTVSLEPGKKPVSKSAMFIFKDEVYIMSNDYQPTTEPQTRRYAVVKENSDGTFTKRYLSTESDITGETIFLPKTRIGADPNGRNGEEFQQPNVLNRYRINTFLGDGTSKEFTCDVLNIDTELEVKVKVDKTEVPSAEISVSANKVTLTNAPAKSVDGIANVEITFADKDYNRQEALKIFNCKETAVFDNRVFFSSNEDYPNDIMHSELFDATYITSTSVYKAGNDGVAVKKLLSTTGHLIAIKEAGGEASKVYIYTPTLDYQTGKAYPATETQIQIGCIGDAKVFRDEVVYLTQEGLYSIILNGEQTYISHKSTNIDAKMLNRTDLERARLGVWKNYLCIQIGKEIYLADSKATFRHNRDYEYEFFYWETPFEDAKNIIGYLKDLYIIREKQIMKLSDIKYKSDDETVISYWTTPYDDFGYPTVYKKTNKKGARIVNKLMQNSNICVAIKTDRKDWTELLCKESQGFSFKTIPDGGKFSFRTKADGGNFSFESGSKSDFIFKPKAKKFKNLQMKFYSKGDDNPFGLYTVYVEIFTQNYYKR